MSEPSLATAQAVHDEVSAPGDPGLCRARGKAVWPEPIGDANTSSAAIGTDAAESKADEPTPACGKSITALTPFGWRRGKVVAVDTTEGNPIVTVSYADKSIGIIRHRMLWPWRYAPTSATVQKKHKATYPTGVAALMTKFSTGRKRTRPDFFQAGPASATGPSRLVRALSVNADEPSGQIRAKNADACAPTATVDDKAAEGLTRMLDEGDSKSPPHEAVDATSEVESFEDLMNRSYGTRASETCDATKLSDGPATCLESQRPAQLTDVPATYTSELDTEWPFGDRFDGRHRVQPHEQIPWTNRGRNEYGTAAFNWNLDYDDLTAQPAHEIASSISSAALRLRISL